MNGSQTQQPSDTSPVFAVMAMMGMFALVLAVLLANRTGVERVETSGAADDNAAVEAAPTEVAAAAFTLYNSGVVNRGANIFSTTCSACHGMNAQGIQGLGKNMLTSEFIANSTDAELITFIAVGREAFDPMNTTGVAMPARGGNPTLTDDDLYATVAYIRTLRDPMLITDDPVTPQFGQNVAQQPTTAQAAPTTAPTSGNPTAIPTQGTWQPPVLPNLSALAPTSQAATPTLVPTAAATQQAAAPERTFDVVSTYNVSCAGCHAVGGEGVPGLAASLAESTLMPDDAALADFLTNGSPTGILHGTGVRFAELDADETAAMIAYMRSLPAVAGAGAAATPADTPEAAPESASDAATVTVDVAPVYNTSCAGCHAVGGEGVPGLAASLAESTLMPDDAALADFLTNGSPTGILHGRGVRFAELDADETTAMIAYMRALPAVR